MNDLRPAFIKATMRTIPRTKPLSPGERARLSSPLPPTPARLRLKHAGTGIVVTKYTDLRTGDVSFQQVNKRPRVVDDDDDDVLSRIAELSREIKNEEQMKREAQQDARKRHAAIEAKLSERSMLVLVLATELGTEKEMLVQQQQRLEEKKAALEKEESRLRLKHAALERKEELVADLRY